ncbi:MAG: hypothetical protein M3Y41_06040 [Pseudomonadota bacterium]|nr:hypothetical protein [Pseudomonadota bacterium]
MSIAASASTRAVGSKPGLAEGAVYIAARRGGGGVHIDEPAAPRVYTAASRPPPVYAATSRPSPVLIRVCRTWVLRPRCGAEAVAITPAAAGPRAAS